MEIPLLLYVLIVFMKAAGFIDIAWWVVLLPFIAGPPWLVLFYIIEHDNQITKRRK